MNSSVVPHSHLEAYYGLAPQILAKEGMGELWNAESASGFISISDISARNCDYETDVNDYQQ